MKNAEVLRLAEALLTPAAEGSSSSSSTAGSNNTTSMLSLTEVTATGAVTTASSASSIVAVALDDPRTMERLRILLETAVRMLYPKGLLAWRELPAPAYPLAAEGEFPLPDELAPAAACYAAWLLTGEARLNSAYQSALDGYLATLEAVTEKITEVY